MQQLPSDTTQTIFNTYEYQRVLGQSNPVWEPVAEYHYPLECKEIAFYVILVFGIIGLVLGIFIGFLFWAVTDLEIYVRTWTIVFCVALVFMLILLYLGGKDRRRLEKELIAETNRKQQEMMRGKK